MCGISLTTASQSLLNVQQDVNQGVRLFKNAARRYWTRKEATTDLVASQQFYTFPVDVVRATTGRVKVGTNWLPLIFMDSEDKWNAMNVVPAMTVGTPVYGFIRGRNEIGLWPIPSAAVTGGLIISYEPRLRDMSTEDVIGNIGVTANSVNVTGSGFSANMVGSWLSVTDGSDGNWYQITGYTSSTAITIENVYLGSTKASVASIIGQCADIPEDYHLGPVYFAAWNYYLKRKDKDTAAAFKSLFDGLFKQYKDAYAAKTTGATQDDQSQYSYNIFGLPPGTIS